MTYLVDVRLDSHAMYSWAKTIGLLGADQGYIVHSLICAAYGSYRMQPFRIYVSETSSQIRLLGYSSVPAERLIFERRSVAEPLVSAAFISEASKEMPDAWEVGAKFAFNVVVAPVVSIPRTRKEIDAFLRAPGGSSREDVYYAWLAKRLAGKAEIDQIAMNGFSMAKVARRNAPDENGKRKIGQKFSIPRAEFSGVLTVTDHSAFNTLFERSIGKHGAFGYGALFLRPSKP
jgi:CRISPR-associated protein Cas6/Cse3/CasE subtype I-E